MVDEAPRSMTAADGAVLIQVRLVPVEVFGVGCDQCYGKETFTCDQCGRQGHHGYGLCDAVSAWSDCNRAEGHIFRFDDTDPQYREAGETLTVWVRRDEYEAFANQRWGDGEHDGGWARRTTAGGEPSD